MFCKTCGSQIPEGASFCGNCGATAAAPEDLSGETSTESTLGLPPTVSKPAAPVPPPSLSASTPPPPTPPAPPAFTPSGPAGEPGHGDYGATGRSATGRGAGGAGAGGPGGYGFPPPPGKGGRTGLWIGVAIAALIVIAAAVTVPLVVLADEGEVTTTTRTTETSTTATTGPEISTTTTSSSTTSTSTTTTTLGAPGDSAGEWLEIGIPGLPAGIYATVVSEDALLIHTQQGDVFSLYAYLFDSGTLVELPIEASEFWGEDLDGSLAVWWEGDYDQDTYEPYNTHIYAYHLPDGPKVEVAGGERSVFYPQVAGPWVTWIESDPWDQNPEEYSLNRIFGVQVDPSGAPVGQPIELVSAATAYALGDSTWTYSLSAAHLAWEVAAPVDVFDAGTYLMDLSERQPLIVATEAWWPSVAGSTVAYYQEGLKTTDIVTGQVEEIDPWGESPSAAPTFLAYFRTVENEDYYYEVVVRGYSSGYEQVLGPHPQPPWLSDPISVSGTHVAFVSDGVLHVFEWRGR